MTAPCRHPAFPTAREARRRAWALQRDPALRQTPVECRWCGGWRLAEPDQPRRTGDGDTNQQHDERN